MPSSVAFSRIRRASFSRSAYTAVCFQACLGGSLGKCDGMCRGVSVSTSGSRRAEKSGAGEGGGSGSRIEGYDISSGIGNLS